MMTFPQTVAVIGAGVSGIGAAKILKQNGYDVTIYERNSSHGGIWSIGYQELHIQSYSFQYHYSDFPWPKNINVSAHPTATQVLQYLDATIQHFELTVHYNHTIISMEERNDGWILCISNSLGKVLRKFDYVIVSSGLFTDGKFRPTFTGQEDFQGEILTERDIVTDDKFQNQNVLVLGYGKSALDMAVLSAPKSQQTYHVFRQPRWTLPETLFGFPSSYLLFSRLGTSMISSWSQPSSWGRLVHILKAIVHVYWIIVGWLFKFQSLKYCIGKRMEIVNAVKITQPTEPLMQDKRFVVANMPENYYPFIVSQKIKPIHAGIKQFFPDGVELTNGNRISCDIVVLSLGNQTPSFPFLPDKQRWLLEREGGAQLYRHILHPRISRMGFIGLNHCFLHMPAVEIGTLWLIATWRGELELPSPEIMEASVQRVIEWKKNNIAFEPTRSYLILTRFQQYLDILLRDLGLSPYRKMPNIFAEMYSRYGSDDYKTFQHEYQMNLKYRRSPLRPCEYDT